jgi:putative nucleotidyltransferase with HDIG domain
MDAGLDHSRDALANAAAAVASFPASRQAAQRVLTALGDGESGEEVAVATEASVALTLAVLRVANGRRSQRASIASVPAALERLDAGTTIAAIDSLPAYEVLEGAPDWDLFPEQLRVHATSVRSVAERVARTVDSGPSAELRAGALLHDIGKPLLFRVHGGPAASLYAEAIAPEVEVPRERELLGIDHAHAGGWLLRHWDFPESLAATVERHHDRDSDGDAAIIRVADMLVHYSQGRDIDLDLLTEAAVGVGLRPGALSELMYELPDGFVATPRTANDCPLSDRELDVLRLLAEGKVYKQIAHDLELSASTVRSHLNRAYKRMGVADRAQAVLAARDNGWI